MENTEKKVWTVPEIVDLDVNLDTENGGNTGTDGPSHLTFLS